MHPKTPREVFYRIAYIHAGSPFGHGFRWTLIWDLVQLREWPHSAPAEEGVFGGRE